MGSAIGGAEGNEPNGPSGAPSGATSRSIDPRLPVIIGVGQFLNRVDKGSDAIEPVGLMAEAVRIAAADCGSSGISSEVLSKVELTAAVPTFTWRYRDPAALVNAALGISGARTWYATVGGNTPQMLMNRICLSISSGDLDLAVLCGAEAGRTRGVARREGRDLDWTKQDDAVTPDWMDESPFFMGHEADAARGVVMPLQTYPVFESVLWHESGLSRDEHMHRVGEIWSGFSKVASENPFAWRREYYTAEEIITPTEENRLLGSPYTKRMVANPDVDMASAAIVCSVAKARALGISPDRWVFVHSGTDAKDRSISERPNFHSSPGIQVAGALAMELAGVGIDEIAHLDVYSCYPSAVQIAMGALGLGADRQLTVYGGLAFAGGPWNNPVGHAIASMVDVLRVDAGSNGLVTANGGNIDKHAFGVYSSRPPAAGFRYESPQQKVDQVPGIEAVVDHCGEAVIEGWAVMHDRESNPEKAHAACFTPEGARTWAVTADPEAMAEMVSWDMTDRVVVIDGAGNFDLK